MLPPISQFPLQFDLLPSSDYQSLNPPFFRWQVESLIVRLCLFLPILLLHRILFGNKIKSVAKKAFLGLESLEHL